LSVETRDERDRAGLSGFLNPEPGPGLASDPDANPEFINMREY